MVTRIATAVLLSIFGLMLAGGSAVHAADAPFDGRGKDFSNRSFKRQSLEKAIFEDAVCTSANFSQCLLTQANFNGADVTRADFSYADLTGADFRNATIDLTSFYKGTLNEANFEKVKFGAISLSGVKLRGANLRKCEGLTEVTSVDFSGADLRGAHLLDMRVAGDTRFRKAKYDRTTRWPKDFDVEASGAILVEEEDGSKDISDSSSPSPSPAPPAPPGGASIRSSLSSDPRAQSPTSSTVPEGVYNCHKISGASLIGLGELEIRGATYRTSKEDTFQPFTINQAGDITWSRGIGFLPEGWEVVSSSYKGLTAEGKPIIKISYRTKSGNRDLIDCVKE